MPEPPVHPWIQALRFAGILGCHPGPWRLRDLFLASEGRRRDAWERASLIVANIREASRDPKARTRPYDWREFSPFEWRAFEKALDDAIPEATEEDLERLL